MAKKSKAGRPRVITDEVIAKLEESFKYDFTVDEACRYAGIDPATYYRKRQDDEIFCEKMDRAKDYVLTKAKKNIQIAVDEGDTELSVKILKMRQNKIYNERTVNEIEGEVGVKKADQLADALDDILEIKGDGDNAQTVESNTGSV